MALKVGELFASFNLDTSGISSAVNSAEKKLSDLGKGLAVGGAAMTAAVTVPLTNAAKTIYEAGSGFDAQMSKVFAIIGEEATGSAENMAALREEALEMGSTTAFTASEAGEAMQYMAMAGWKVDDMLAGLSPIMDLAAASGESLGTVSDIVTDALTAFGLTAEDTAHFTDVLAAASSNSNTNVAIMGESFKYVAPLAGSLGYSVDDVAVALGLMANAGIKGSMAGTSLRQVISNLISPTDAQAEAMEALGISLFDSNGKVKSFAELMGDLRSAAAESGFDMQALNAQVSVLDEQLSAGTITQEQYDTQIQAMTAGNNEFLKAISDLAGARGLSGLLAIMNATEEDFQKLTEAVQGSTGAAKTMAQTMLDNAQGDITLFNSALEGLEVTLWGLAEGGFREAVQGATDLVNAFRNADQETLEGTLRLAGLAAAIGPAMAAIGGIITILPKLTSAFTALTGPVALVTIGLIALGAAAMDSGNSMGKTFVKGATKAGNKVRQFGKEIKKQIPQLTENMGEFLDSLTTGIQEGLPGILEGIGDILTTGITALARNMGKIGNVSRTLVRTLASGIANNMPEIASAALELMTGMAAALIERIPVVLDSMSMVITSLVKEVNSADWSSVGSTLNTSIQSSLSETGVWFKKLAMGDQFTEEATWEDVGVTLATNVLTGIQKAFGNAKDFVGSLLLGEQYNPDDEWGVFGEKIIDKIFESADKSIDSATSFVSGILTGISGLFTDDALDKASETLSGIAGTILDHVFAEIPHLADKAGTLLEKLGVLILGDENSEGLAANVIAGATTLAGAIFTALETGFSGSDGTSAIQKLLDVLGKAFSQENISRITANLEGFISAIFTGMTNVLPNLADKAVEVVRGIIDLMFKTNESGTSLFGSALTSVQTLVTTLVQEIVDFIPTAASTVTNLLTVLLDTLFAPQGEEGEEKSLVQGALDSIGELVGAVLRSVPGLISTMGSEAVNIVSAIGTELTRKDPKTDKYIASGLVDSLGTLIEQAIKDVVALIPSLGEAITGIIGAIGDVLLKKDDNGDYLITSLADSLITLVKDAVTLAAEAIPGLADTITGIIGSIADILSEKDVDTGEYKATGIVTALTTMVTDAIHDVIEMIPGLGSSAVEIIEAIGEALFGTVDENGVRDGGAVEQLLGVIEDIVRNTLALVPDAIASLTEFALTAFTAITNLIFGEDQEGKTVPEGLITSLTGIITTILNTLTTQIIPGMGTTASNVLTALFNTIFAKDENGNLKIGNVVTTLKEAVENIFDTIKNDVIPTMGASIGNILTTIAGFFTPENLGELGSGLGDLAGGVLTGIVDTLVSVIDTVLTITDDADTDEIFSGILTGIESFAEKVVEALASAIPKIAGAGGKILGKIAEIFTGEGFTATFSAGAEIAGTIIEAVSNAFSHVSQAASSIIGGIASLFSNGGAAQTVFNGGISIAKMIIDSVANAIPAVFGAASKIVNKIGEAFNIPGALTTITVGATTIAKALLNAIIAAIPGLADLAKSIVTTLGSVLSGIDWAGVIDSVTSLGSALIDAIVAGIGGLDEVSVSLIEAIGNLLEKIDWDSVSVSLDGFANMLMEGFRRGINALTTLSVDVIDAIGNLFTKIDWEKATAFTGNLATILILGIYKGINAMTTGATQILEAISGLLQRIDWEKAADTVSSLAQVIFDGICEGAKTLVPNATELISAIGRGIEAAAGGLGEFAGTLVGNIVKFVLSPENWLKLLQLGVKILEGIATGITNLAGSILAGAFDAVAGVFTGLFKALGLIPTEELDGFVTGLNVYGEEIRNSVEDCVSYLSLLNSEYFHQQKYTTGVGIGDVESLQRWMSYYYTALTHGSEEVVEGISQYSYLGNAEVISMFQTLFDTSKGEIDRLSALYALSELGFADLISDEFYAANEDLIRIFNDWSTTSDTTLSGVLSTLGYDIADAIAIGFENGRIIVETSTGEFIDLASAAMGQVAKETAAAGAAMATGDYTDVYEIAMSTLPDAAQITGEDTAKGMADGINNNAATVQLTMDQLADSVVREALERMTYETGYSTGWDYADAINKGLSDCQTTLESTATEIAVAVDQNVFGILNFSNGFTIGQNFGNGIAFGISSMTSTVYTAAWNLGITAANALSSALDEHSPSKVTGKSGRNFGLGFIGGIEDEMSMARQAAESMGLSAAYSLRDSIAEMRSESARQLSVPVQNQPTQAEQYTAESERIAQQYVEAIARALDGAQVVMGEEAVGVLVMPTVSKEIAHETSKKREATV